MGVKEEDTGESRNKLSTKEQVEVQDSLWYSSKKDLEGTCIWVMDISKCLDI
jgi:hypothetical protein